MASIPTIQLDLVAMETEEDPQQTLEPTSEEASVKPDLEEEEEDEQHPLAGYSTEQGARSPPRSPTDQQAPTSTMHDPQLLQTLKAQVHQEMHRSRSRLNLASPEPSTSTKYLTPYEYCKLFFVSLFDYSTISLHVKLCL